MGRRYPPDRGERLRQALQHLRSVARAAPRASGVAGSPGGEGCSAQFLHLAQQATRTPPAILRRLVGVVTSNSHQAFKGLVHDLSQKSKSNGLARLNSRPLLNSRTPSSTSASATRNSSAYVSSVG